MAKFSVAEVVEPERPRPDGQRIADLLDDSAPERRVSQERHDIGQRAVVQPRHRDRRVQ